MSIAKDLAEGEGLAWLVVAGIVCIVGYEVYQWVSTNAGAAGGGAQGVGIAAGEGVTNAVAGAAEGVTGLPSGALDSWSNLWNAITTGNVVGATGTSGAW